MSFAYQPLLAAVSPGGAASFDADAGVIQFAGQVAGITVTRRMVAGTGQMTAVAPDIGIERFRSYTLAAAAGDIAADAQVCRIAAAWRLAAEAGTMSVNGKSATLIRSVPSGGVPPTGTPLTATVGIAIGL